MISRLSGRVKGLLRDLQDPDIDTRLEAALSLNGSAHPQVLEALRLALADDSSEVAGAAAQSLALVGDDNSLALVIGAAERSTAPWPRAALWAAVQLTAAAGDNRARVRVTRLLDIADQAGAEGRMQASLLRPVLSAHANTRDRA